MHGIGVFCINSIVKDENYYDDFGAGQIGAYSKFYFQINTQKTD